MDKEIDLRPEHKRRLTEVINSQMPEVDVLVYGSRINGRSHSGSDLDIALRARNTQPINIELMEALKQTIQDINLPFMVDIRDWATLPSVFKEEIMKQHVIMNE